MTLEELIKTLEGAQEKATEGEWRASFLAIIDYSVPTIRTVATVFVERNAQAIAVRHNTAGDVLRELSRITDLESDLKMARSDWDAMESCASQAIARAESAEAEVGRLKASK